jgi:glycyl-tRNA synthetase beta chain
LNGLASFCSGRDLDETRAEISDFVRTRLAGHLTDTQGVDAEVVRAVLPARWRDPVDALAWVEALAGYREKQDFQLLATGFKRCRNILKGGVLPVDALPACRDRWLQGGGGAAGEDLGSLPEPQERELLAQVAAAVPDLIGAEELQNYHKVFAILSGLGPAIDVFFESVRVNAEDEALRVLRHAFLREIHGLFAQYADFAAVAPTDS